ncbi:MAG: GNAT family N-acetyltransferase [Chitinophagaceae bacterium]|jgi:GNAT superfamily N-acetyltransferase
MIIRRAERKDISAMLQLIQELAEYEKAPQEVTVDPAHFEASGFGPQPVWWAFVVEDDSQPDSPVVAFALYYIRYSTWKGQVMYLEDIIVTSKYRGKGIGKMLMAKLIEEARDKGFRRITWQVLEWNEPAIQFYKKYQATFDPEWVNVVLDLN